MKNLFIVTLLAQVLMMVLVACAPDTPVQILTPVPTAKNGTAVPGGEITVPAVSIQLNLPDPNPLVKKPNSRGQVADALMGLWHGFISPVTLIMSMSGQNVGMYEVHNEGQAYNLGFFLGIVVLFAILGGVLAARRR